MAEGVASGESTLNSDAFKIPGTGRGGAKLRLSVMMFLELFIWGAWYPLIFGYLPSLKFTNLEQSWILNSFAIASFAGMFFSNQFADRNFSAERFLGASMLIGGLAMLGLGWVSGFWPVFLLMLVHCLVYVPTISIANSIAFAHLKDPQKDFGPVRLWGTIGWIAASWPFVFILVDWAKVPAFGSVPVGQWLGAALGSSKSGAALQAATRYTFITAGIASLMLAAFSVALPHTPARHASAKRDSLAWLEAVRLLKVPFVLVLFIVTFFDSAVLQSYFFYTGSFLQSIGIPGNWVMPVMSIGQIAEIATMAMLGLALKRLGWRRTMIIGLLGQVVRFALFAFTPVPSMAVLAIFAHGICYAFFFATVYIFVDDVFPKDARASAQGLFNFLILGLGVFVANFIAPQLITFFTEDVHVDRASDAGVLVSMADRSITLSGSAAPSGHVLITFGTAHDGSQAASATADETGRWTAFNYFHGRGTRQYEVSVSADRDAAGPAVTRLPTIEKVQRVNYQKVFLVPGAAALLGMLLLLTFFHPPKPKSE